MSFRIRTVASGTPGKPFADRLAVLRADWSEHLVTVVAASFGVVIVATIAFLMGMA
jgi:hypothetical protein